VHEKVAILRVDYGYFNTGGMRSPYKKTASVFVPKAGAKTFVTQGGCSLEFVCVRMAHNISIHSESKSPDASGSCQLWSQQQDISNSGVERDTLVSEAASKLLHDVAGHFAAVGKIHFATGSLRAWRSSKRADDVVS
jgi:hypothetical protein